MLLTRQVQKLGLIPPDDMSISEEFMGFQNAKRTCAIFIQRYDHDTFQNLMDFLIRRYDHDAFQKLGEARAILTVRSEIGPYRRPSQR